MASHSASKLLAAVWLLASATACAAEPNLNDPEILRIPGGGVQPEAVVGADGTLHVVFLRGNPKAADVWYARRLSAASEFSEAIRVNATPGGAVALGSIRGARLALDREGKPLVAWNGSQPAASHPGEPFLFARGRPDGGFAPEVDVIRSTGELDGGGSVVTGILPEVLVVWHGSPKGTTGETNRGVFLALSRDEGATFLGEERLDSPGGGVCGCCALKALGGAAGQLAVLYRSAGEGIFRDATLLIQGGRDRPVRSVVLDRWSVNTCPLSSAAMVWWNKQVLAAWETREAIHLATVDVGTTQLTRRATPEGTGKRKHPSLAVGAGGVVLVVWVENTGWNRGGDVAWQLYDESLQPMPIRGRREGVPVWSFAAAFVTPTGRPGVIY